MLTGSIFKIGVCLLLAWVSLFPHNNYTICFKGPVDIIAICQGFSLLNLKWLILYPTVPHYYLTRQSESLLCCNAENKTMTEFRYDCKRYSPSSLRVGDCSEGKDR